MSVQIFVDYNAVDLGENVVSIPCTYQLIDIKDINKRKGSTTKTITIPRTAKNDKIFGFAFDLNVRNAFDKYSEHRILIEEDTLPIFDGFLKLTNVTERTIEFFCFKDISKLKSLFGDKTLQDLNLADLDHLYDETIFDTWIGTYPTDVAADYFYPVIDYGLFRPRTAPGNGETPAVNIAELYPMVYNRRLVLQVCLDNGYSLNTTFFDDPITNKTGVAFTNSEFIHSSIGGIAINGFQGYSVASTEVLPASTGTEVIPIDTEELDPLTQWSQVDDEYVAGFNQTSSFVGNIAWTITNNLVSVPANLLLQKYDGSWTTFKTIPMEGPTTPSTSCTINEVVTLATGEKFRIVVDKNDASADIFIQIGDFQIDPSAGGKTIGVGEFVQLAPNLPPMKQADYISAMFKIYNWVISVDDVKGEIRIETFDEFYFGGEQVDMSPYLTLQPAPSIQYLPLDYSRKYDFKYKHDDKDLNLLIYDGAQGNGAYLFGDGKLYLSEQGEATLIGEVPFSPSVVEKSFTSGADVPTAWIDIPTMIIYPYVAGEFTQHVPRMLINAGLQSIATLSSGTASELYFEVVGAVSEIPLCYFQKRFYNDPAIDVYTQNLSFSTPQGEGMMRGNLVDDYYRNSVESLSVSPQVVAYFNLNSRIISNLNFSNLWYLDYFKAIFRLNKIVDYLPNGKQATKVELIKVGVYNPNVPTFQPYQ